MSDIKLNNDPLTTEEVDVMRAFREMRDKSFAKHTKGDVPTALLRMLMLEINSVSSTISTIESNPLGLPEVYITGAVTKLKATGISLSHYILFLAEIYCAKHGISLSEPPANPVSTPDTAGGGE